MSDRFQIRKGITVLTSGMSVVLLIPIFWLTTFEHLVFGIFVFSFFRAAVLPLVEATTLEFNEKHHIPYGKIRIWGSAGFIVLAFGLGKVIDMTSLQTVLYAIFAVTAVNLISILSLPRQDIIRFRASLSLKSTLLKKPIILFFLCCMLMQISHGTYYSFFSIHLEHQGYTKSWIGVLWAFGVFSEIFLMYFAQRLIAAFGLLQVYSLAFLLTAIRWCVYSITASFVPLLAGQILHSFSYGVFHVAAITHTYCKFTENNRGTGQSLYSGITFGAGSIIGFLLNGAFYDRFGPYTLFGVSAVIAFVGFGLSLYLAWDETDKKSAI
jgi:PPP family 3-phenylpropionic acid transporter